MHKIGCKIDEVRIDGSLTAFRRDLEQYAAIGIEAVEIPVHGLDVIKNGLLDEKRLREVLGILKGFDFEYSVHSPNPLNLMDEQMTELHLSVFDASLKFTRAIGSKILVYHAGRFIPEERFAVCNGAKVPREVASRLIETEKNYLVGLAEAYPDITICIENARPYLHHSPYCYGERIHSLKQQVENVNRGNVRINLDVGHLYMAAQFYGFDHVEAVETIGELIAHTHVHDNFGGAIYYSEKIQTHQIPFGRGDSHMPVGWGDIPIGEILSVYLPAYQGMLMMELRNRYFDRIRESEENLADLLKSLGNEA